MRSVRRGFTDYEFEDKDEDFNHFQKIVELEKKNELTKIDADVIISLFELNKKLPSLTQILFDDGFLLPKNDGAIGNREASWRYERKDESARVLDYKEDLWDTMYNRSDHHHIDIKYQSGQVVATYQYHNCENNYGRDKERYTHCMLSINNQTVIEKKEGYGT